MLDLHRHTQYSTFDGFGKPEDIALVADSLGYSALGIADHGNTNGLVQHYFACKDVGIKPILGVEAYFLPVLKEKTRGYHLCLFAKNKQGYANLNHLQTIGEKQKYYTPIITFKDLESYNEGLICTTACVASYFAKQILNDRIDLAEKALLKMQLIFGDNLYIEIQPYKCDDDKKQEFVNMKMMELGQKLGIKRILTSDSHYPSKKDFDTYMAMHKMAKHDKMDIETTYKERYMPSENELRDRFMRMHEHDFDYGSYAQQELDAMFKAMQELEDKVEQDILDQLEEKLPKFTIDGKPVGGEYFIDKVIDGLKKRGKFKYIAYRKRAKEECSVIIDQGYDDYFLMVADYVNWAKAQGIAVGPGRGSACNSLVCYALGITEVDSVAYKLDFNRFMREGKKKMPDIDIDFETARRGEVIDYIVNRYPGYSAQICSYGLYKVDNLVNDLVKIYNITDKNTIKDIKKQIKKFDSDGDIDFDSFVRDTEIRRYNKIYPNMMKHFQKLYKKVRFIGTHAAGVAISGNPIEEYTALRYDAKTNKTFTNYDLVDLENIGVIKFDILGLKTEEGLAELRELTGETFSDDWTKDPKVLEAFCMGNTDGIFQFEKTTPKKILQDIECDCFEDIVAVNALNRPAMLDLDMHRAYEDAKLNKSVNTTSPYYEYVEETYGCIIYQEQVLRLAINIGGFTEDEADILVKMEHGASSRTKRELDEQYFHKFRNKFVNNAMQKGVSKSEAINLFDACAQYGFNKGHSTGYSMIAVEEMYYKLYYPTEFWCTKIKHENNDANIANFKTYAVASGALIFLPHVNYSMYTSLREIDGENIIQEGLIAIKGIGIKAAETIENERKENGPYTSREDFLERCKGRAVTTKVISILDERGALQFDEQIYLNSVTKYNTALYSRGISRK